MTALPNRDRRAERRAATRREILDAAWQLARRDGLPTVTLREIGRLVGMRAPSLYSHFDSKNAIYDAMFAEAWEAVLETSTRTGPCRIAPPELCCGWRETFFDFAVADLARYQLMNRATDPRLPAEWAAYAQVGGRLRTDARHRMRATRRPQADRPGPVDRRSPAARSTSRSPTNPTATRWRRQLVRIVDMYCDEVGVPGPRLRRNR